jgi:hypothetical protein
MSVAPTEHSVPTTVIDLRAPADPELSEARLRKIRLAGLIALVVLNIADLITTRAFLSVGAEEANPLGRVLLGRGVMPYVKGAILLGLGWSAARARPKLTTTCAIWFVVGVYTTAIVVNLTVLAQAR